MEQNRFEKLISEFESANNKRGGSVLKAAEVAGLPFEKVSKYVKSDFDAGKMLEIIIAMIDGVSDANLTVMVNSLDKSTAEELRRNRMALRTDEMLEIIAESSRKSVELLENMDLTKLVKKQEKPDDKQDNRQDNKQADKQDKKQVDETKDETEINNKNFTDKENRKLSEEASNAGNNNIRTGYYKLQNGRLIQVEPEYEPKANKRRFLSIFKKASKDKIVEQEKRSFLLREFISAGCKGEKLVAFTEAIRMGVSADFLRIYINKDISADELRLYTAGYLAIYDPDTDYNFGKEGE